MLLNRKYSNHLILNGKGWTGEKEHNKQPNKKQKQPYKTYEINQFKKKKKTPNCLMGVSWGVIKISEAPANAYA